MVPEEFEPPVDVPDEPYGVVSIHRYELLEDRTCSGARSTCSPSMRADAAALRRPPVTAAAIEQARLESPVASRPRRIPRLTFFPFIALLRASDFLFTDSGGSQEECYYLDQPCLVHRMKTERREGLGENVVLSGFDFDVVRDFLDDPDRYHRRSPLPIESPSDVIVDDLVRRGFAAGIAGQAAA